MPLAASDRLQPALCRQLLRPAIQSPSRGSTNPSKWAQGKEIVVSPLRPRTSGPIEIDLHETVPQEITAWARRNPRRGAAS
jgi:hypothetical protein